MMQYEERMQRTLAALSNGHMRQSICWTAGQNNACAEQCMCRTMLIHVAVRPTGYECIAVYILQMSVSVYSGVILAAARP